ncbi:hypothetical protein M2275_006918 [Rhodococcus opacus]|nr:hypothetical protein [Rhodococcus opacus]
MSVRHNTFNTLAIPDGDVVRVESDFFAFAGAKDDWSVMAGGRDHDVCAQQPDGRWLFSTRRIAWWNDEQPEALVAVMAPVFAGLTD